MLTEHRSNVAMLRDNLDLNRESGVKSIEVAELDWAQPETWQVALASPRPWDLIVASDVIWLDYLVNPFLDTVTALMTPAHTVMLLGYEKRSKRVDKLFLRQLKKRRLSVSAVDLGDVSNVFAKRGVMLLRLEA